MSLPSFDEYCERHHVRPEEYGQAFAAYLHEVTGGEWEGGAVRVGSPCAASTSPWSELQPKAADENEAEDGE